MAFYHSKCARSPIVSDARLGTRFPPLQTSGELRADCELGRGRAQTIADRSVSQQSQFGCPERYIHVQRQSLRRLQPYAGLRNIDGADSREFVVATRVAPRESDVVLTQLPFLASKIVPGSHDSDPTLTLDPNQVIAIVHRFQNRTN